MQLPLASGVHSGSNKHGWLQVGANHGLFDMKLNILENIFFSSPRWEISSRETCKTATSEVVLMLFAIYGMKVLKREYREWSFIRGNALSLQRSQPRRDREFFKVRLAAPCLEGRTAGVATRILLNG